MLKIKKILAILIAFCFLVSVTAAAVSAGSVTVVKATQEKTVVTKVTQEKKTLVEEKKSDKDEENEEDEEDEQSEHEEKEKKVEDHHRHHKHFHPDHWEKHRVPHKKFINNKIVIVYVYESVFVKGYWAEF
jgi:ABC-type Zn2+ transport system substrate-binding protein/surface adhesin